MGTRTEQKLWVLTNLRLFAGTPDAFIKELERITRMENVDEGGRTFDPWDPADRLYLVKRGTVRILEFHDGRQVVVDTLSPGDLFGNLGVGEGSAAPRTAAEAAPGSIICIAHTEDFLRLLRAYPDVSLRIIRNLATRLATAQEKIRDLALHSVGERIVSELRRLGKHGGTETADRYVLPAPLTHEELAAMVGATRETVTKLLSALRARGIIEVADGRFAVAKETPNEERRGQEL